MISLEWPKEIPYRGVTIKLTMRFQFSFTDYGYELPGGDGAKGYLDAAAALAGARAAVDRALEREGKEVEV